MHLFVSTRPPKFLNYKLIVHWLSLFYTTLLVSPLAVFKVIGISCYYGSFFSGTVARVTISLLQTSFSV